MRSFHFRTETLGIGQSCPEFLLWSLFRTLLILLLFQQSDLIVFSQIWQQIHVLTSQYIQFCLPEVHKRSSQSSFFHYFMSYLFSVTRIVVIEMKESRRDHMFFKRVLMRFFWQVGFEVWKKDSEMIPSLLVWVAVNMAPFAEMSEAEEKEDTR